MSRTCVLIVDDEPNILTSLRRALQVEGYRAVTAHSGAACLEAVPREGPDLVLLDVVMPGQGGIEVLESLRAAHPELPVVMMSGNATIEAAVRATRLGAVDFVEKPLSTEKLLITMDNALKLTRLRAENRALKAEVHDTHRMIGEGAAMRAVQSIIEKTAPTNGRVLITGDNGTGKELVARAVHQLSQRAEQPFVKVNCAAIPGDLIESELFGHEKGSFTGATGRRKGKFELAHQGTLFLDEIGDMSLAAQAKVLRALQEGEIERVGGDAPVRVDVRVLAATNKDLRAEIQAGRFREDLFYRLNVVPIRMPSLRERKEDIPRLVAHFLKVSCRQNGMRSKNIEEGAVSLLMQLPWPGNVRELKNMVERLVILGETLTAADVKAHLPGVRETGGAYRQGASLKELVAATERDIILAALDDHHGQVAAAAQSLQMERSHLYKKMRALGIETGRLGYNMAPHARSP